MSHLREATSVAKGKFTNVLNRLRTIAIEDVSPRCVEDVTTAMECISMYERSNNDVQSLARACWILCKTTKTCELCPILSP